MLFYHQTTLTTIGCAPGLGWPPVTKSNLNLCLACRDVQPNAAGGLSRAMRDLAQALAREGNEVHLLTNRSAAALPDLEGVSVIPLFVPPGSGRFSHAALDTAPQNLMHAAAVYREVSRIHEQTRGVDAVLAPLWRSEGAVCMLDGRFPTIVSCMTSIRTITEVDSSSRLIGDIEERLSLERAALRRCRYLHGLTEAALAKTVNDYSLDPDLSAVIGRGVRDRRGDTRHEVARNGPLRILFVGRIEPRKGVGTLLAAARELIDQHRDVTFTLAGPNVDPGYHQSIADEASRHPRLHDAVRFAGEVSDSELARLYEDSDIVCVPSRYESHGIVLLEAMMFGKPIVTCDAGGIDEVVENAHDALLVPPDDPSALSDGLRRLVSDPGLRSRLGAAGRNAFERRFDAQEVARRMQSFVEEVRSLHSGLAPAPGEVSDRLERLLSEVLSLDSRSASSACEELLDPVPTDALRGVRATALRAPAPKPAASHDPAVAGPARLTAVVVTRDRPELVSHALDSLERCRLPLEIVVIDDNSSPAAARRVAQDCSQRPQVKLRRSDHSLGCAGGRLLGIAMAQTDLVLVLDDDAELMPGALEHLSAELDRHPAVGAVTATVVDSDGIVLHSGGVIHRTEKLAVLEPYGVGRTLDSSSLPESGPTDWVPGTAVLIRRALLSEFEIDEAMSNYFEDAEWCYRISMERPGVFRRSREAVAVHHFEPRPYGGESFRARSGTVGLVAACARFYERHGVLLGPALFQVVPELQRDDGVCDLAAARLLMELVSAKGPEWMLAAWMNGDLAALLDRHPEIAPLQAELAWLRQVVLSQEETLRFLHTRNETLDRIEQGGWWRLRAHIVPVLRLVTWLRGPREAHKA
ncbi:MAG: glycosyltransferase [Solirubrobacteraceae bacterium]